MFTHIASYLAKHEHEWGYHKGRCRDGVAASDHIKWDASEMIRDSQQGLFGRYWWQRQYIRPGNHPSKYHAVFEIINVSEEHADMCGAGNFLQRNSSSSNVTLKGPGSAFGKGSTVDSVL